MDTRDVEWNRDSFDPARLLMARSRSWALVDEAFSLLAPGMTSVEARLRVDAMLLERTGARPWHPTQLRVDPETCLPFGARPDVVATIREDSVVFVDMGPLVDGYEGDVATTRRVDGSAFDLGIAAQDLHAELVLHWKRTRCSGRALYTHAAERAQALGYVLATKGASGHRLADHPHEMRGQLKALDRCPRACAWVLEVQLLDARRNLGAFYEDLLV